MFHKILVPLDGSLRSSSILTQVRRLLKSFDAEVLLFHVVEPDRIAEKRPVQRGEEFVGALARARRYLERLRDELRTDGIRAEAEVGAGDPTERILEQAERFQPALIAMSTHGRTGWARLTRGSVAERVLRHSDRPILLVRPEWSDGSSPSESISFDRILVALDGSEESSRILPLVEAIACANASEVVIEHAAMPIPWLAYEVASAPAEMQVPRFALDRDQDRLSRAGIPCRVRLDSLTAAQAILEAAEEERADLIALTTHGRTGPSRWAYGSVAEAVLRHANAPVLILRTSGAAGTDEAKPALAGTAGTP